MNKLYIALALLLFVSIGQTAQAPKVKLQLYYESLCPYSYMYVTGALNTALQTPGLIDIFELEYYPYGNARQQLQSNGLYSFTCQHGPNECYGNVITSCVLGIYGQNFNTNKAVVCIEKNGYQKKNFNFGIKKCGPQFGLNSTEVIECANNKQGNQFQHQIADDTDALVPPHKWVPWMVINGHYNETTQDQLQQNPVQFICQTYQGNDKPQACSQFSENFEDFEPIKSQYSIREEIANYFLRKL